MLTLQRPPAASSLHRILPACSTCWRCTCANQSARAQLAAPRESPRAGEQGPQFRAHPRGDCFGIRCRLLQHGDEGFLTGLQLLGNLPVQFMAGRWRWLCQHHQARPGAYAFSTTVPDLMVPILQIRPVSSCRQLESAWRTHRW